jgi:alpha-tubulin suppressor-like RCC1 family protein
MEPGMGVPANDRISGPFVCTGGETLIPYDFKVLSAADLAVWRQRGGGETRLVLNTDYTVDGVGADAGGNVVLLVAALDEDEYVVEGDRSAARALDLVGERAWKAPALNAEWDSLQIQIAELKTRVRRALMRSRFDLAADNEAPDAIGYLYMDADGNLTIVAAAPGGGGGGVTIPVPIEQGGTGAATEAQALANLGALTPANAVATLNLKALAFRDTVLTAHIGDKQVTIGKIADGTPGTYLARNVSGVTTEVGPVTLARVTRLGKGIGFAGGLTRHFATENNELFAVGDGTSRQNGYVASTGLPLRVSFNVSPGAISKVVVGAKSTYVIDSNGWCFSFGGNAKGQLGHGDTTNRHVATRIEHFVNNSIPIADVFPAPDGGGGEDYTIFLGTNGKAYYAGGNVYGQGGLGATTSDTSQNVNQTTPVEITALGTGVTSIACGSNLTPHTLALKSDGSVWGTGCDTVGQLGRGVTVALISRFVQVVSSGVAEIKACSGNVGGGTGYSMLRRTDNSVQVTGLNGVGQLGLGDTTNRSAWTTISGLTASSLIMGADAIQGISGAILPDKQVRLWGYNNVGQLGTGNTTNQTSPATPAGAFQGKVVQAVVCGITTVQGVALRTDDHAIWAAGYSTDGNLGTGSTAGTNNTFARAVGVSGTLIDMAGVGAAGTWGLTALRDDGRVLVCGDNSVGQLGLGGGLTADCPTFMEVPALNRASAPGLVGPAGPAYSGTSTTSLAIGTGTKVFNTTATTPFLAGDRIRAKSAANPSRWMEGLVASNVGTVLTVTMDLLGLTGTYADWNISLTGEPGDVTPAATAAKDAAQAAATAAASSQTAAASSASAASTSASNASTSATVAAASASAASTSASNASTSASNASTSATAAAASASAASTSATSASTSATNAGNSATAAASSASGAATSATNAASSATAAANAAAGLSSTSTSSVALGTGDLTFTTQAAKQFTVGQWAQLVRDASNYAVGIVTAYNSGSGAMTINVADASQVVGSGTHTAWTISITGKPGPTGPAGTLNVGALTEVTPASNDRIVVGDTSDSNATRYVQPSTLPISTATQTALDAKAPLASPTFSGTPAAPTAAANTNTTQIATTAFVQAQITAQIATLDVSVHKGTIDCSANPNYPAAERGDVYRVSVAGKIGGGSGPNVESGDMLICNVDSSASGNHATVGANWSIVQANLDGAVIGPASATAGSFARFNGTTGKLLQDGVAAGIANDNVLTAKNSAVSGEFARFTADGIEGRTASELRTDANLEPQGELLAQNAQTGTAYTLVLADKGRQVSLSNASAITLTVPTNASVAFPTLSRIELWQEGAGQVTVAAAGGVTIRSSGTKLKLAGQYSAAVLTKVGTDTWQLAGDIAA